ncbi:SGNH/GDSL hydrolase family protein [Candidatus Halobonum tyrrellensis]|uniref:Lipolytic protein G-D-S-L family n=1 Tax=Candidatus Halobonum tyrrellensis G22 TaxID=1324957 RepID=V4IV76_9EURY|nr:SGNH/GDSL hydrolase family protein [Candidatus Halobonum tyrrellensis]ESP87107.1 lipolytic protein G-D-S-L family [Candidatus Halobonum tyrrellensis G22]
MRSETHPSVSLHNVAETTDPDWTTGGDQLCRVPASVRAELNDGASDRLAHATNAELRFVPESDGSVVEVTVSAAEPARAWVFWGSFQPWQAVEVGPTPETFELGVPERLRELDASVDTGRFDPRLCRVRFDRFAPVALHGVAGDCRPPTPGELPDERYLAYGTSITEGAKASAAHLSYVSHAAQHRGYDAVNLGCSGSAYCEPALADYVAARDDWDVASLALSVNMANGGFSPAEFRERADYFVNTVAGHHPESPVVCVTLFPYFADVTDGGDAAHAGAYRDALRSVVADSPHDNVSLVAGPDLLSASDLTWDVLHPGDAGMRSIGDGLAEHLDTS